MEVSGSMIFAGRELEIYFLTDTIMFQILEIFWAGMLVKL